VKRLFLAISLLAGGLLAQTVEDPNERIQKLVSLQYADPQSVQVLLQTFGVDTRADNRMKIISLSGRRASVMTAEAAIKQLDVPSAAQKDIELTVYFVIGTDEATGPAGGNPIPQDLQGTVATIKSTFPYRTYTLLDALSLQTRSGVGADTTGQLSGNRFSTFRVRSASVQANSMIQLDGLHAGIRIPRTLNQKQDYADTGISTDVVDVKEGQKLVVGRSSLEGPGKALFLVLIAKVVN